jgi:hypothetical protein
LSESRKTSWGKRKRLRSIEFADDISNPQQLVQKLWNYGNLLRDDRLSYGDLASQARHNVVSPNHDVRLRSVVVKQSMKSAFLTHPSAFNLGVTRLRQSILQKAFTGGF